jgi:hypothetical protein
VRTADKSRNPAATVQSFIDALEHPLKDEVVALRQLLLHADPAISEEVKWNAPSFRTTEHFATMHLRAKDAVQLVLHLGARSKRAVPSDAIADPQGLLKWLGPDRASIVFTGAEDLAHKSHAVVAIVRQWIRHVSSIE